MAYPRSNQSSNAATVADSRIAWGYFPGSVPADVLVLHVSKGPGHPERRICEILTNQLT